MIKAARICKGRSTDDREGSFQLVAAIQWDSAELLRRKQQM
jgi:hypothetical protein